MVLPFTLPVLLVFAVIAQGILAAILLAGHPQHRKANRWLAILLLLFSLWLTDSFLRLGNIYRQDPNFYFLPIYYSLAFGPILFFYVKSLTQAGWKFSGQMRWHFLPVFLQLSLYLFLQLQDYEYRRWFWMDVHRPYTYNLEFNLTLISLLVYTLLSLQSLRQYRKRLDDLFTETSRIDLNWLRSVLGLICLLCGLWLVDVILREGFNIYPDHNLSSLAMGFILLILAVGSMRQNSLRSVGLAEAALEKKSDAPELSIDPKTLAFIQEKTASEKFYLDPDLTLTSFSEHLSLSPRLVSRHLNQGLQLNFADFINGYRVRRVKEKLQSDATAHYSLLGIALDSGFNSKSTFNRIFRKFTGMSPSQYAKQASNPSQ